MLEAYSVGVRISLINGAASGLMALARQFKTTHVSAMALKKELKSIELMMLGGGMMAATGMFGLHMIGKTLPYAKEYANQLSLMNTLGMKQADIAKVVGNAWKTSFDIPTTTAAENLKSFRELRSVFGVGHEAEASTMLPVVGKIQGILTALTGHEQEKVGFDLVKSIELRTGVMTPAALQKNSELMTRTLIAMGGSLSVGDYHGALKMGKSNTAAWSDDFTYNYLPTLMQELKTGNGGAQSAGTYLSTFSRAIHGHMQKSAYPYWIEGGLVKPQDVVKNATGGWQMKPGAVSNTTGFEANPYQWVQSTLRPAVDKIMAKSHLSMKTVVDALFSDRNASFTAYNMLVKSKQYDRDKETISGADGLGAYNKLLKTNPELAQLALQKQWQNLLAQLGFSIMPALIKGMTILMGVLRDITKFSRAHPTATKMAVGGFAGLSALLTLGGLITMTAGAFKALALAFRVLGGASLAMRLVPLLLGALATGLEVAAAVIASPVALIVGAGVVIGIAIAEIARHWDASKNIWQNIKSEFGMFVDFMAGLPGRLLQGLPGWAQAALGAAGKFLGAPAVGGGKGLVSSAAMRGQAGGKSGDVYMDGRKVGKIVAGHLVPGSAAQAGNSTHDSSMSPAHVGQAYVGR